MLGGKQCVKYMICRCISVIQVVSVATCLTFKQRILGSMVSCKLTSLSFVQICHVVLVKLSEKLLN